MERTELYEALEYGKYGKDLCDHTFQLDDGSPYFNERFNGIWLAGLFTLLIKEAGRLCDNYASDMFIDLQTLHKDLNGTTSVLFEQETYQYVVGIRDMGVDSESFVKCHAEREECSYAYREMFLITVTPDEKYKGSRKLSCYRVSPSSLDTFVKRKREFPV